MTAVAQVPQRSSSSYRIHSSSLHYLPELAASQTMPAHAILKGTLRIMTFAHLAISIGVALALSLASANALAQSMTDMGDSSTTAVVQAEMDRMWALADPADATITSAGDGDWSDTATWNLDRIPQTGDRVYIRQTDTITLDSIQNVALRTVRLDGTLNFATDQDTLLRVDTLVGGMSSTLTMGTESSPVPVPYTARLIIDDYDDPNVAGDGGFERSDNASADFDPTMLGLGLLTHGRFESSGAERAHGGSLATEPAAGDSTLLLDFDPNGWRTGDALVVAGTDRDALGDERRTIASIDDRQITLNEALLHDHNTLRHSKEGLSLKVHVINLERNVVIETAAENRDASTSDYSYTEATLNRDYRIDLFHARGHVLFMHSNNVAVRNTRFHALGRTNKHGAIDDTTLNSDGTVDHRGMNPRARYPVHFHRAGLDGTPGLIEGSVADDSPGWCFVNHGSHAKLLRNVAYDCDGAGFVTERGDELGSFINNISIRNTADEGKNRIDLRFQARKPINDFGFGGHGFWLQGINVDVQDNVASGAGREAFALYPLLFDNADKTKFKREQITPSKQSAFGDTAKPDEVPAHTFANNVAYGSNIGIMVGEHRPDAESLIETFTGWQLNMGSSYNYSDSIRFNDLTLIGDLDSPVGIGAFAHHGTAFVSMYNAHIEGFALGVQVPRAGNQAVDGLRYKYAEIADAYLNNVLNLHVLHTRNHDFQHVDIVRPRFGNLSSDALAKGVEALAAIDQTDDLDIDSSNVRSNGFAELATEVTTQRFTEQQDYYLHYTQTGTPISANRTVDTRHQRDGFLPKQLTVTHTDGKQYRLFFKTEQQAAFVPFDTDKYQSGIDYDINQPLDPDAPNNNRNANLPAAFLDQPLSAIADLFQRDATNLAWADFATAKDRNDTSFAVDAASDYPGFALAPGGRLLPKDYATDTRYEHWPRSTNLVAMRVDDLPDRVDYLGDDNTPADALVLDADSCTTGAICLPALTALAPTHNYLDDDPANGKSLLIDGVFNTFEMDAPFALTHKSFTWHANLRPLDVDKGVIIDSSDGASGFQIALDSGRLLADSDEPR